MSNLLHLLWTFSVLSVLGFGGGKGIIPEMHREVVESYQWVTNAQFTQFYTIGKLVPGPTTIFAALIGYMASPGAPLLGALVATVGMFVPSSAIMVGADVMWERFKTSPWRLIVSRGIGPAIVGLVWASVYTVSKGVSFPAAWPIEAQNWTNLVPYVTTAFVAVAMMRTKLSAPILILIAGALGTLFMRQ
ncbi:MAG TPA: chromate transporter [Verrucomicrobiae bacterium]|nr:chromate transporter [Verrucomicrobiae bacterium]